MNWHEHVRRQLPPLGLTPERESEIVEELAQQMEDSASAAAADGAPPEAAEGAGLAVVADWTSLARDIVAAERSRVERAARAVARPALVEPAAPGRWGLLARGLWQDARWGVRALARHRSFTVGAALTLALTIGSTTAVFSVVHSALLAPLPFPDADRVMAVSEAAPSLGVDDIPFSPPDFLDYESAQTSFAHLAVYRQASVELAGNGDSERIDISRVFPSLFEVLDVQPMLGRAFRPDEAVRGDRVTILSHALWTRRFEADEAIIGTSILLDREPYVVVGVMPASGVFPLPGLRYNGQPAAAFVPHAFSAEERQARGGMFNNSVVGRLARGMTLADANAETSLIAARIMESYGPEVKAMLKGSSIEIAVRPLHDRVAGRARTLLWALLSAVSLLLTAGCVNVGSLLLALSTGRQREMAVRASLGAGRGRLARQLLVEHLMLAVIGGSLGLLVAWSLIRLAPAVLPATLPRVAALALNGPVLAFAVAVSVFTAVLFGLIPLMRLSRVEASTALVDVTRTSTGGGVRLRRYLAAAQCALAVLLLVPAGLLGRTLYTLIDRSPGFRADQALTLSTFLPIGGYPADGDAIREFYRDAVNQVLALPGVHQAGASMDRPLSPLEQRGILIEGEAASAAPPMVVMSWITPGYLEALGVPLVAGRTFTEADDERAESVVLVSDRAARQFWPAGNAVGKRIQATIGREWSTVVGVVGNVHEGGLDRDPLSHVYVPLAQVPGPTLGDNTVGLYRNPSIVAATGSATRAMSGMIRQTVQNLDPQLALSPVQVVEDTVRGTLGIHRLAAVVVSVFAIGALLIAATGLHGVLAYNVAARTREIGIRMALGATRGRVLWMVARDGLVLAGAGLAVGLALAAGVARLIEVLLVGVAPTDPGTFVAVILLMAVVAVVAVARPARAATHVNPAASIREA